MHRKKGFRILPLILCLAVILSFSVNMFFPAQIKASAAFACGADVSWLPQMEAKGYKFYDDNGVQKDCLQILKEHGMDSIRIRVWVNPSNDPYSGHCSKTETIELAKRCAKMGFRIMIDFHYSDSWADPGKQNKPAAWVTHSFSQLLTDVYNHTYDVLTALKASGVTPEWVQVGNETNNGMLWEDGMASKSMKNFAQLVTSGYDAVKAVFGNTKVIVHISNAHDNSLFRWIFDGLKNNGGKYDVIGMSFYPETSNWSSLLSQCTTNMQDMAKRYGKEVMICEVGMDNSAAQTAKTMLSELLQKVKSLNDGKGLGVFYWEPQCYNWASYGKGAWSANGRPTVAMDAFIGYGSITPTSTSTPVPTYTQRPTATEPKPTPTPNLCKLSGYIAPDFSLKPDAAPIILPDFKVEIEGSDYFAYTDKTGFFEINNIPSQYSSGCAVRITKPGFLSREINNIVVKGSVNLGSSSSPVLMWAGDVLRNGKQDNAINMTDIMDIAKAFNTCNGDGKYNSSYDINKDNSINMSDIMIVAKHFNTATKNYPAVF